MTGRDLSGWRASGWDLHDPYGGTWAVLADLVERIDCARHGLCWYGGGLEIQYASPLRHLWPVAAEPLALLIDARVTKLFDGAGATVGRALRDEARPDGWQNIWRGVLAAEAAATGEGLEGRPVVVWTDEFEDAGCAGDVVITIHDQSLIGVWSKHDVVLDAAGSVLDPLGDRLDWLRGG